MIGKKEETKCLKKGSMTSPLIVTLCQFSMQLLPTMYYWEHCTVIVHILTFERNSSKKPKMMLRNA
jgi:hypothetical protein